MSVLTLEAKLERQDSTTPWGFRMQGGKDFSSPITIARVTPGSLAAKCGLQQGDIILKIGSKASETLKHKDAQDSILSYGNKLDLLLQRGGAPTYDKFSAPSFSPATAPAPPPPAPPSQPAGQSYNTAPKPFGASKPAPYTPSAVDSVTQSTQNINLNQPSYQKYADTDDKGGISGQQSRSFKFLQGTLDSGQEPPSALRPTVDLRRSPSPNAGVTRQFNSPAGLYSSVSLQKQQNMSKPDDINERTNGAAPAEDGNQYDAQGKRIYRPSETFKLIQEQENPEPVKTEKPLEVKQTRTIKVLEKTLGDSGSGSSPAPAKAPPAPKPGVWAPGSGGSSAAAPAAKPFTPAVAPPPAPAPAAPAAPRAPPPKPSGVGAVRGKVGDAIISKSGDANRIPICASCGSPIRGPFVSAMGKSWCPDHFICANPRCGVKLIDIGFVEESGFLYCEKDYELYFAPHCTKCEAAIVGECVNALNKQYHPACFLCYQCKQPIGGNQFHLEDGHPYCENDWRQMFQTMCSQCNFPIEPGDKWVEALNSNFHSECFNCSTCQVNLEGQAFYAKTGKPYCKKHAR